MFIILYIFVSFIILYLIYLSVIIFLPVFKEEYLPIKKKLDPNYVKPKNREDVSFDVNGTTLRGWFYPAESNIDKNPCLILSHGFGGTKECKLEEYALNFNKANISVLTYDYRHYGDSDGEPRQLLSVTEQHDDLRSAIKYIKSREDVDEIYLWGTSAGANYGLIMAAEDNSIKGVICQCGAYDHKEDGTLALKREGFFFFLKLLQHGVRDKWRGKFGLSRHMLPAYGKTGTTTFIRSDKIYSGISELVKGSDNFKNEVCASFMLLPHGPDPLIMSKNIDCPVLLLVCEYDEIISPKSHIKLMNILGSSCNVVSYPIGHFDIYIGEWFRKAVGKQIDFINKCRQNK